MTNVRPTVISLVAVVLCGLAAVANAIPLVDGKFDPSEGYTYTLSGAGHFLCAQPNTLNTDFRGR